MAKMKKEQIIAALKEKQVQFDETANYNDLAQLLKDSEAKIETTSPLNGPGEFTASGTFTMPFPQDLLDRAHKIGVTVEQIASLGTPENVKAYCDRISPATNPDAIVKADIRVMKGAETAYIDKKPEGVPSALNVEKDDIRAEQQTIERLHRKLNIKHNNPNIKTITKTVVYDCQSKRIVSATYKIEQ